MGHRAGAISGGSVSTSNPITFSLRCSPGDTILVLFLGVTGAVNRAGGSPSFNGVYLTQADITRKYATSPEASAELWYLLTPETDALHNVIIPNTGGLSVWPGYAIFGARAGNTTVLDSATGGTGATANPSLSRTPSIAGDVMVEVLADGNPSVPTARTHTSIATQDWGAYVAAAQYGLIADSGAVTMGFTIAADDWGMVMAAFKERLGLKTANTLVKASVKSKNSLLIASIGSFNG